MLSSCLQPRRKKFSAPPANVLAFDGSVVPTQGVWTYLSTNYTVPSGGASVLLYCEIYQPTGAITARFDDAFLTGASGQGARYYHGDHLGSARLMTDSGGNVTWSATYLPFGQEWNPQATANHYKFTGQERDPESNNDYFTARFYSNTLGRFLSPDPAGNAVADTAFPQSWNLYSYVMNNPLNFIDPSGLLCVDSNGVGMVDEKGSPLDEDACAGKGAWIIPMFTEVQVKADPLPDGSSFGEWLTGWWDSFRSLNGTQLSVNLNRCAAANADKLYSTVLGNNKVMNAVAGNSFAAASQLLLGPERSTGAAGLAGDAALHAGTNLGLQAVGQTATRMGTTIYAVPGTAVELGGQTRWATMVERYVAQRVKDLPEFAKASSAAEGVLSGKILLDGLTYLSMEASCTMQ